MEVILASKSPRRLELLSKLYPDLRVVVNAADETLPDGMHPKNGVEVLAVRKGAAVLSLVQGDALIVSSDTLVEKDGLPLGKPQDREDAFRMLRMLSGTVHNVHTGVAVHYKGRVFSGVDSTAVTFKDMTDEEIYEYISTGEPMDKAGAYGIQGGAALFAEKMVGDYYNVMGLPVCRLRMLLCEIAPELFEESL